MSSSTPPRNPSRRRSSKGGRRRSAATPPAAVEQEAPFLARLRSGDELAFSELILSEGGRLLAVARHLLRDDEEARDAVQDAFVSVIRHVDRFQGEARLATWLHRIVVNACLTRLRRRRSAAEDAIEPLLPRFTADGHQVEPSVPWEQPMADRLAIRELVRQKLALLPVSYRTVLLLRDVEQLSTSDTAAALGIDIGAVRVRLHRARQALRGLLDPHLRRSP